MSKRSKVHAFSTGGVVFRLASAPGISLDSVVGDNSVEIVLVGRPSEPFWALPKGTPKTGESREETALREVREESGIEARIVGEVGEIEYEFSYRRVPVQKTVFHYLMLAVGGNVEAHDHEYDEARWFPIAAAIRVLSYENEKDIVRRAEQRISDWLAQSQAHE